MKHKKSALMQSVIALLLCVSMLVSTTFAWFTDSVVTGINTIAAGNLDVELYHTNATARNEKVEPSTNLFRDLQGNPILWEPGVVSYENLRVVNAGDLALAYQLAINTANENYIVYSDGTQYGLSQILKVGVVEGGITATDRAGVVASVEDANWTTLANFLRSGSLLPEGAGTSEETWGVVIYWEPGEFDNYWNLNNGKTLSEGEELQIDLGISLIATQEQHESDAFGSDYDTTAKAEVFPEFAGGSASATVVPDGNNQVSSPVELTSGQVAAYVPAGVQLAAGTTELSMSVTNMGASGANIVLGENEAIRSLDVHIEGVAANNAAPITVTLKEVAPTGLNMGNYKLYHVENGSTNEMTLVDSAADFTAHNQFKYDPATGDIVLYMATFSEVTVVADLVKAWEGGVDHSWYTADVDVLTIANADQLWSFSQIVGGMAKDESGNYIYTAIDSDGNEYHNDSFKGKTIKLIVDINLADDEKNNDNGKIFYPIGYYNSEETYDRTNTAISSGLRNFEGTFDGNGHTIANFYHNTWEMKGDHNWYSPEEQYYRDGMGLFGRVYGGTVKNLTVSNFSSDGEIATTGCIAAYADGATFENIAIFNCNPRVYNIGNGGIVGCVGWYAKEANLKTTFKNITVDNSNKISALWGSYDVACGGIVGQYYPTSGQTSAGTPKNAGIDLVNCHVAAQMDVYNDVCGNYMYYAYRYAGMMIGSIRENTTTVIDGVTKTIPDMTGITATGCTVNYGDWNDYYYCEFVKNGHPSYAGQNDYKFSRVPDSELNFTDSNGNGKVDADERASVTGCKHDHTDAEDNKAIYLPFHQLFTGYGWGVNSIGLEKYNGIVTNLDITEGDQEASVEKFEKKLTAEDAALEAGRVYRVGDLFTAIDENKINDAAVQVAVTGADGSEITAEYVANTTDWAQGTLTFNKIDGVCSVTIQDYNFCKPTSIILKDGKLVEEVEEFAIALPNTDKYLYRVGNLNEIQLKYLFTENGYPVDDANVSVSVDVGTEKCAVNENTTTWENGTIDFANDFTGLAKITISEAGSEKTLNVEVVDATNVTSLSGTISGNVVLLKDCGLSSLTVSGRNTVYGNGFTATYTGNGQYLKSGLKQGVVTVSENGTLDNLRIVASIYPSAFLYYGVTSLGEYVQQNAATDDRYPYQLSAVAAKDNATISNCYIYGGRNNIFVNTGDVTITNTVLECGTVANVQIQSNSSHTITFNNVTTIQHQMNPTIGDASKTMLGAGVIVGPETNDNPKIVLNGDFKQYNWVTVDDKAAVSSDTTKQIIGSALKETGYNHTINGKTASNLGIIYMNISKAVVENNTKLPYELGTITMSYSGASVSGQVYSLKNASADQIYSDTENADKTTENDLYQPQFKYSADLGGQLIAKTDDGDEHCYREGDTIYVLFPSGDSKELDLAGLVNIVKYTGQNLALEISLEDEEGKSVAVKDNKVTLTDAGKYIVTYTVTDTVFYDKDGNQVGNGNTRAVTVEDKEYSWVVTVEVSLKDTAVPDAYFAFDATKQKMGYYKPTIGDVKQYLPFLAGLKIYDYNGQTSYLRFDGDADFNKIASITITGYSSNKAAVEVKLTDGGVINTQFLARANSGGGSTYTGKIKTSNNTIYFVTDSGTSNKDSTTTAAYWYVDYYKFTGNNGVAIQSAQQTFNSTGKSASTPSGSFSTSIKYTVTYDANGGNCGQNTGYATSASAAVTLPTPTRSGYIFAGWYTAASGGTRVGGAGESYTPSANITLYAQWGKPCTVTYNANGGSCDTASEKYNGTALKLPSATRDGYWFIGWYKDNGVKVGDEGADYVPEDEITLYAHWQEAIKYTVTYNANGGTCGTENATYEGTALTLPTPTRTGYTFLGWHDASTGGNKIDDAGKTYTPSANITLYAQWEQISYTITISKQDNATVTIDKTTAHYGDTISVTVSFSQSNSKTLTVKDASGNTFLSKSADGTYTFTMPASNVTIEASSSGGCVTPDTLVMLTDGTQKQIQYITNEDMLLVWDFYTGEYAVAPAAIVFNMGTENYDVLTLKFSDGTNVGTINGHRFFDKTANKYVLINETNVADYVGHEFVKLDGESVEIVTLKGFSVTTEYTTSYSIMSAYHYNFIVEGILSDTFHAEDAPLFEYFEIGKDMKFDEAQMQEDIEKYGLYTYEDFADYLTYEQFVALNVQYMKISVEKGAFTYEGILKLIETYLSN